MSSPARAALLLRSPGGGLVEAYPQDTHGKKETSASFLCNGTRSLSENAGFSYDSRTWY